MKIYSNFPFPQEDFIKNFLFSKESGGNIPFLFPRYRATLIFIRGM